MTSETKTHPARPGYPGSAVLRVTAPHQRKPLEPTSRRPPRHGVHERLRTLSPLLLVLTLQAALTLRLADPAFADGKLALLSGHQGIGALVHEVPGTRGLVTYLSNAPFLDPVLATVTGGDFAPDRLLSLLLLLGATTLLWSSTRALFGRSAAIGAVLVFGLAGPTLFLGPYAAHDGPAVLLCAASLRILIATARRSLWTPLLAVPTTVLAIAANHATALYLPVLALVAVFSAAIAAPRGDRRLHQLARGVLFAGAVGAVIEGWLALFGPGAAQMIETAMTNRLIGSDGSDGSGTIMGGSIQWAITALVLGLLGTLAVARRRRAYPFDPHSLAPVFLTLTLSVSTMLAPVYQLHTPTSQSLQGHIEIGLLFSAAAAGVALSSPLRAVWQARTRYGVNGLTALLPASIGAHRAGRLFG